MPKESKNTISQVLEELIENFENPHPLVKEIKEQTQQYSGFRLVLVGTIVKNILESRIEDSNIPEQEWIQRLIQEGIINNWIEQAVEKREQEALDELQSVGNNKEQELIDELQSVENDKEQEAVDESKAIENDKERQDSDSLNNQISILSKFLALVVVFIIFVVFPILLLRNPTSTNNSPEQNTSEPINSDIEVCQVPIPSNTQEQDELISKLEALQNQSDDNFSKICFEKLYSLWIEVTPRLAARNTTQAVNNLCKIPKNSDSFADAKFWIKRWSNPNDANLSNLVKSYIQEQDGCPAAEDIEIKELGNL